MLDDLTIAIRSRTAHIVALRFTMENERHRRMAIEIKGLKAKAIKAGTVFERLNRAYDKLIETGDAHAGDVESLAPQLAAMQDDISFAVATLGNSVSGSSESGKPVVAQNILAGVGDLNQPKVAPESIVGQQTATSHAGDLASKVIIDSLTASIPAVADRVALGPHPDQPAASPEVGQDVYSNFQAAPNAAE